jgi:hypothetical protein
MEKSSIFWDITPCSVLKVNRRFGQIYRLHLQGRISQARCSVEAGGKSHGVTSQKTELFITTAVWNPQILHKIMILLTTKTEGKRTLMRNMFVIKQHEKVKLFLCLTN